MNYNYDDEIVNGYNPPNYPPPPDNDDKRESVIGPEPQAEPIIIMHSQPQEISPPPPSTQPVADGHTETMYVEPAPEPVEKTWSEPSYSEAAKPETCMYTPGLNTNQYYPRQKTEETSRREGRDGTRRRGGFLKAVALVLICALVSGAATYGVIEFRVRNGDIASPVNQVVLGGTRPGGDYTAPLYSASDAMLGEDIYDMACAQVVGVKTEVTGMSSFFGQSGTTVAASGSGFIISDDGYILTNYHVIETAYRGGYALKAVLNDGTEYDAKIIGFEESNDVAVIKIEATGLNAAVIGDSDGIKVGQRVYAVGNPFGELVYTMTDGIISGLNRIVTVERKSISTFQINAAVNSGNSGGPVYNENGEVIGIVTAKFMSSTVEGIGFAIPINDAIGLALDLVENGYITGKAYMGIQVRSFTQAYAEFFASVEGAYVVSVTPGSAADNAGIKVGDIITKLGEAVIDSEESLIYAKNKFKAGETTTLTVRRSGEDLELTITFDEDTTWSQQQSDSQARQQQQPQIFPIPERSQMQPE